MEKSQNNLTLFENKKIRYVWNTDEEDWYFSVVDIVEVLTETDRPRKYWNDLKKKLTEEGSQLSDNIGQLKMIFLMSPNLKICNNQKGSTPPESMDLHEHYDITVTIKMKVSSIEQFDTKKKHNKKKPYNLRKQENWCHKHRCCPCCYR